MKSKDYWAQGGNKKPHRKKKTKTYPIKDFYAIFKDDKLRYYSNNRYEAEKYQRRNGGTFKVLKSLEELFNDKEKKR